MPKATASQFITHFTNGRIPQAADMLAANFVFNAPGFPELKGPREWSTLMSAIYAASPKLKISVEEQAAEGNAVFSRYKWTSVHDHEFMGMPPTGKNLASTAISIVRLDNQKKITEYFVLDDYLTLFRQMGSIPLSLLQDRMDVPGGLGLRPVALPQP